MKFLYRYYFTFFSLHLKDNQAGTNNSPAWLSALFQVGVGLGGLFLNLYLITGLVFRTGSNSGTVGSSKYAIGFIAFVVPTLLLHYLLFGYYQVSKQTGLTPFDQFTVSKSAKYFFWAFWIASLLGLLIVGRYMKVNSV